MDRKFRINQLPDNIFTPAEKLLFADGDNATLSAAQDKLVIIIERLYKVAPMATMKEGDRIQRLAKIETIRRGAPALRTPPGKRCIVMPLEDGSVAIEVIETGEVPEGDANMAEGVTGTKRLTRHTCRKGTVFILDEDVLIGIPPRDGVPQAGDKYPDSIKVIIAKLGYAKEL